VRRSWDVREGPIETKSRAGRRTVPIASVLREHLIAHKLCSGRSTGLVFGRGAERPFAPESLRERALAAWETINEKRAEAEPIEPIGLHECRHTAASLMMPQG
jgi:integrase